MKKLTVLFTALFCLTAIFTSCEKEEPTNNNPNQIDAKVVNGNNYNSKIDSVYFIHGDQGGEGDKAYIKNAKYQNGGFSIKLDAVPSNLLYPITDPYSSAKLTISDKTAKCLYPNDDTDDIFIATKNGKEVGFFFYSNISLEEILSNGNEGMPVGGGFVYYIYVDKDVNINGTVTHEADRHGNPEEKDYYNLSFKAGWNTFVQKVKSQSETLKEYEYTTAEKLTSYKWYFFED